MDKHFNNNNLLNTKIPYVPKIKNLFSLLIYFNISLLQESKGEEAGIKSTTLKISGDYSYV